MAGLSGCSAVDGILHNESTHTSEDVDAFAAGGAVDADWVPDDATQITVRTSTLKDAEDAVILLHSSTGSLPGDCLEVPRTSAPTWAFDGAPSASPSIPHSAVPAVSSPGGSAAP
ncbi:hypothetical protein GCM10025774_13070 [Microbacterium kyungheense]